MTAAQLVADVAIPLFVWLGFAVLFGIAVGKTIAAADRREGTADVDQAPATVEQRPAAIELGTRLDVRL